MWMKKNMKWVCCCIKIKDNLDLDYSTDMTEMQRKHRIKKLWKIAKRVYLFQSLNNKKKDEEHEKILTDEGDDLLDNVNHMSDHEWKWWIIRSENTLPQMWSIITNFLTIYALFVTPVVVVFPELGDRLEEFELFVDITFTIDILMSFVRLEDGEKEEDFNAIRLNYLKSTFIFDCIAALPGLVTLEKSSSSINKLCRFIHYDRVF